MNIDPASTRIGWVGTGVMGQSMCQHLIDAGYSMTVYSRTREKAESLLEAGAAWADSPRAVAEQSDVVFAIVGYPKDVREVFIGETGILDGLARGSVAVDMTTSEPQLAKLIASKALDRGSHAIDAPVSGGDVGAREARLSIMIGGDEQVVQSLMPLWKLMGKTIVRQGPAGSGQHAKMVNQIAIAGTMVGMCEALLYGHRAGLNLETVLESISSGAAGSWSLTNLAPRILGGDFEPGFFVEHFIKDLGIALKESERMGISLPGLSLAHHLYIATESRGYGKNGTQALELALSDLSGIDWPVAEG